MAADQFAKGFQAARLQKVVVAHIEHEFSAGMPQADVPVIHQMLGPAANGVSEIPDAWIRKRPDDAFQVFGGGIVHHDQFEIRFGLTENALQAHLQEACAESGEQDAVSGCLFFHNHKCSE